MSKGETTAYLKLPVLREQRRIGAVRCNTSRRKGQVSLTHTQETHPGRSVLLLLECTVKTFSFSWSQWYSTPEFKALETPKKENNVSRTGHCSSQHALRPHNTKGSVDSCPTETADLAQFTFSLEGLITISSLANLERCITQIALEYSIHFSSILALRYSNWSREIFRK